MPDEQHCDDEIQHKSTRIHMVQRDIYKIGRIENFIDALSFV